MIHQTNSVLGLLAFCYLVTGMFSQSMADDIRKPVDDERIA